MRLKSGSCTLRPASALLIVLAPLLVYALSDGLLRDFGLDFGTAPQELLQFDRHSAEAARLNSLGAFFLLGAAAAAAFAYFLYTLRLLQTRSLILVGGAFLASLLIVGVMLLPKEGPQETAFSKSGLVCTAFGYGDLNLKAIDEKVSPRKVKVPDLRKNGGCAAADHARLRTLLRWNQIAVLLGLTSLIFGSICCLAGPVEDEAGPGDTAAANGSDPVAAEQAAKRLAHWEEQSERLNGYLYLSAILLVTGLLFTSAILKWPSFALPTPNSYGAHVDALTAYYGYTYTVLLGSFYVPVAVGLSARVRALKPAVAASGKVPEAFKGPLQLLKIAAAIFSTSLAPILAGLLSLG